MSAALTTSDHDTGEEDAVSADVLVDIVGDVFETMLADAVRPFPVPDGEPVAPVLACIRISGGWNGEIVLRVSRELADAAATELFQLPAGPVDEADMRDVVGEFVNVIGGNVKALLPGTNALSLPEVSVAGEPLPSGGLTITLRRGGDTVQLSMTTHPDS